MDHASGRLDLDTAGSESDLDERPRTEFCFGTGGVPSLQRGASS